MPAPRKDDITNGRVRERGEAVEEESCFLYTNQPVCGRGKSAGAVLPLLAIKTNTFLIRDFFFVIPFEGTLQEISVFSSSGVVLGSIVWGVPLSAL